MKVCTCIITAKKKTDFSSKTFVSVHEYKYMAPFYEASSYRIPRFSSEYGLQSLPSYETLETVLDKQDLHYWSDMLNHRQHHPFGKNILTFIYSTIVYYSVIK